MALYGNGRVIDGEVLAVVDWPLPPPHPGGPTMNGTRRYRLRIYDGNYEVLHKRTFFIDVDLDSPQLSMVLNERLQALTQQAIADNQYMGTPRLEVCDWDTGRVLLDWG